MSLTIKAAAVQISRQAGAPSRRSGPSRSCDSAYERRKRFHGNDARPADRSRVPARAQINGSHSRDLLKGGLAVEHLVLVPGWREAGGIFDEQEKAALAWAEAVSRLGEKGVSDSAFEAASPAFDEKKLADLTITIGLMNAYNRISISFRTTPTAVVAGSHQTPH